MRKDAAPDIHDYLRQLERAPEIFRRSWDAIAIYDLDGRVVLGNAAARAMIGSDRATSLRGQHFGDHMTLEAATSAAREFARCAALGEPATSNTVVVGADGQPIPVRIRLVPACVDGRIVGVIAFARDERPQKDVLMQFMHAEQQFRALFENHPDSLALHDAQGRFVRVNAACERITGYSVDELIGQTPALIAPPGGYDPAAIRAGLARGDNIEFEYPMRTKSGRIREVEGRRVPLRIDGELQGYYVMLRDVTEQRASARYAQRQATRIAELYRIAAAAVPADEKAPTALEAGVSELGAEWGCIVHIDDGTVSLVHAAGTPPAEMPFDALLARNADRLLRALEGDDIFADDDPAGSPRSLVGMAVAVEARRYGAVVFARNGEATNLSVADRDYIRASAVLIGSAIQQSESAKRLGSLAFGDMLTGLPNRALLQDRLEQTLLSARRNRRSFAAHYIDIDRFKAINDTDGHQFGDAVLVAVAGWLRSRLRDSDTIARFGGDEFVVVQPEIESRRQVEELAAKLCAIREQTFRIGKREIGVTISVGCAIFPADAKTPSAMLAAADAALYAVKNRGRDGYAVGRPT